MSIILAKAREMQHTTMSSYDRIKLDKYPESELLYLSDIIFNTFTNCPKLVCAAPEYYKYEYLFPVVSDDHKSIEFSPALITDFKDPTEEDEAIREMAQSDILDCILELQKSGKLIKFLNEMPNRIFDFVQGKEVEDFEL